VDFTRQNFDVSSCRVDNIMQYISLILYFLAAVALATPIARFPLRISADIQITAHQIPKGQAYPPRLRNLKIYYDYIGKRARAQISEGYEAAKIYIRRYDQKNEYMVRLPPIGDCKRSYLGETMPFPDIPTDSEFIGVREIDNVKVNYFMFTDAYIRIHMYFNPETGAPVRLIEEAIEMDGVSLPMLTYDYTNVSLEPQDSELFEVPTPHSHGNCDRHQGGFPYLHVFHYFVKF